MDSAIDKKINILGKTLPELEELFLNLNQKPYRAKQALKWIHQRGISNFDQMTDFSKELRSLLNDSFYIKHQVFLTKNYLMTEPRNGF